MDKETKQKTLPGRAGTARGGTCGDDDPPLVGGHVGGRPVLLIHVGAVAHGVGLGPCSHQLPTLVDAAVHGGLPARQRQSWVTIRAPPSLHTAGAHGHGPMGDTAAPLWRGHS